MDWLRIELDLERLRKKMLKRWTRLNYEGTPGAIPANSFNAAYPDNIQLSPVITGRYFILTTNSVFLPDFAYNGQTQTSAANAVNTLVLDLRGLNQVLDIITSVTAGAPTVAVSGSVDNSTFTTIDTGLAIGAKHYNNTTVGATTAVTPLSFRFVKIVVGAAGVGNTSTIIASAK